MFIIAITGGIATGKSTVAKVFKDAGIPVVDADQIAREVVEPGEKAWKKIQKVFGAGVFTESGELNRAALADVIFDDPEKRVQLNEITHPQIHKRMYKEVFTYFTQGHNFIVMELPLLFETGVMGDYLHKIITVSCEEDIQLARLIDRNQMSEANAKKRIQSQMSLSKKCDLSHFVIDNSGSVRDTEEEAQKILNLMVESNHHWKLRGILLGTAALMLSGIAWYINSRNKITGQH